jgi:REP element-mobilizing transposase RayT
MARPLRIEFPGAIYHLTARGNALADIYSDDSDRQRFLSLLRLTVNRYGWHCHAYCLMDNHYHLLVETGVPTLSRGMKFLNGTYTQYFNRRHHRVGHVFQGRFKAILVQRDVYLLELARYIALNPVRANMVRSASEWPWSSYRATAGYDESDACLTTEWILAEFSENRDVAQQRYCDFIAEGLGRQSPWQNLKNQIYLGDDDFVCDMLRKLAPEQSLVDIPKDQKQVPAKPLAYFAERYNSRNESMAYAYLSGHYTLAQVGKHFGVSYATVSRAVKQLESGVNNVKRKA